MFLSKVQVLFVAIVLIGTASCGYVRHKSSEESDSRSFSSEEYQQQGVKFQPLVYNGVPLSPIVHTKSHDTPVIIYKATSKPITKTIEQPIYTVRYELLEDPQFLELCQTNLVLINKSMGPKEELLYLSKAKPIPMPEGLGKMYYIKGYFRNGDGYKNKCKFFLYSKDNKSQVLQPDCHIDH